MNLPEIPPEITKKLLEILGKLVGIAWDRHAEGRAKRKAEAEASIALSEAIQEMLRERPNVAKAERKLKVAGQVENLDGLDAAKKILKKIKALEAETEKEKAPAKKGRAHPAKKVAAKKAPAKKATAKKAPAPRAAR